MNERQDEYHLRQHLRERAESGSPSLVFRSAVREQIDHYEVAPHRKRSAGALSMAAALALLSLLGGALLLVARESADESGERLGSPSSTLSISQEPVAGVAIDMEDLRIAMSMTVPESIERVVAVVSSSEDLLELSLAGPPTADPPRVPLMRVIVPPAETSVESIIGDLTASLGDTRLVEIADDRFGGHATRVVRMESDRGTTVVGFKLGPGVFVTSSGVDRRYEVHLLETSDGPLVIWVEAARDGFDTIRRDVDLIVSTLELR